MQYTGLSRATVSSVLGELGERGLITERRSAAGAGMGRPAARVALDRSAGTAIAVDIGVRHVAVAVGDLSHSVLAERWVTAPRGHAAARGTRLVLRSIEEAIEQAGVDAEELVGAAVSLAAPVATDSNRLAVPGVLPGWTDSTLAESVAARWGIPVVTENDANLGALGEALARPAAGGGDILFVKVASRIGLGIARGNRVVRGRNGYAGEFGHVTVRPRGQQCWCGRRGCLELYAGGDGMLRRLAGTAAAADSIPDLVAGARASRERRRVVDDGAAALARALTDIAVVLDPARIVLGGELTGLGDLLVDPIRRELGALPFGSTVELRVSPLGERASLVGALGLVLTEPARFVDRSQGRVVPRPADDDHAPSSPPLSLPAAREAQP
ncbi:transcriptional regulator, MarR family [Jatrophihabitans endophyticus]|uniref:Transcriptional regulator, MarR family n=1 Tax=Jatrophihabitans endophyticus TaxID=1206085 RepID=A0A1M5C4E9_9ACTN|nr:transcriptional regulator, MarR family [Jatrophihabitans endophyticus]